MPKSTMTKEERAAARAKARPVKPVKDVKEVKATAKVKKPVKAKKTAKVRKPKQIENAAAKPLVAPASKPLSNTKFKALSALPEPEAGKPSPVMYKNFQAAYDFLNKRFFASSLPQCVLVLSRKPNSHGYFHAKRWTSGENTTHELALNPDTLQRSPRDVVSTILHEMCHVAEHVNGTAPKKAYHNKAFFELMKSVGLHCSSTADVGGKETGAKMSHYIEPKGVFEPALADLLATGWKFEWASFVQPKSAKKKSRQGARVKYTCVDTGKAVWGAGGLVVRYFPEDWEDGDELPPIMQEEIPEGYGDAEG